MPAIVTKCEEIGRDFYSLELTPRQGVDSQLAPWKPGVHLFSIRMHEGTIISSTIASVVVPGKAVKPIAVSDLAVAETMARAAARAFPDGAPSSGRIKLPSGG